MEKETITIPRREYEELKRKAEIDYELVEKIKRSLEGIKHGRVEKVWQRK